MKTTENFEKNDTAPRQSAASGIDGKGKLRWAAVSVVIAILSIWTVASQWKDFSLTAILDYVAGADWRWLTAAILSMFGFIFFEGCSLHCACHALHYAAPLHRCAGYAAADIYFSAITPSATGGQPACAYLMMRDGIPGIVSTAVLLLTLAMYSLAILVIALIGVLISPSVFFSFGKLSRILIVVGFIAQALLSLVFLLLIQSEQLLERICRGSIHFLCRIRLLHHEESRMEKLAATMDEYRRCVVLLSGHRSMLRRSFLFNLLQRASHISVSMLVYLAMGGDPARAGGVFTMQSLVVLGSNCAPIPGAMGVADYLMVDGFKAFLDAEQVVGMELLSRSLSFYCCVLLCGIAVLILTGRGKRSRYHQTQQGG